MGTHPPTLKTTTSSKLDQAPPGETGRFPVEHQQRHSPVREPIGLDRSRLTGQTVVRLFIVLVVIILLVNVPLDLSGIGAAQLTSKTERVVLQDGRLLRGDTPQIYLLQDHRLRPFSSQETFDYFFQRYRTAERYNFMQVQRVDEPILNDLSRGDPIYRLVRCPQSGAVYAVDGGRKHRLEHLPTTTSAPWDRIEPVSCAFLNGLATGPPIPFD